MSAALLAGLSACDDGGRERAEGDRHALQHLLDDQAAAVTGGGPDGARDFLATVDPAARGYRLQQQRVFANLERLPLAEFSYRLTGAPRRTDGDGTGQVRAEAEAELSYRLRGYDHRPVVSTERLSFVRRGEDWYVRAELSGSDRQLWEQGEITAVRGARSVVLGVGQSRARLRALARDADRAVTEVTDAWPHGWPRRAVLEVPGSAEEMAGLLDASPSEYEGIAAVTTGESGVSPDAPADRVLVNPDAYGELSEEGRRIVLTHEAVHVATRTHTSDSTPMWLSEGLADWIGYRGSDRTPREAAPELTRALRKDGPPRALPSDEDFRFGGGRHVLGRAYEGSRLACELIARDWGESRLAAFYVAVGRQGKDADAAVDEALRAELGLSRDEFTARWRAYVEHRLG
ncbi:hypothetical protein HCC30_10415 [Streptomyces sp. HNM0574]|nr:hypothetical protein [Streptomyces sp. HNM0574]